MSLRECLKDLNLGMSRKAVSLSPHNLNWSKAFFVTKSTLKERVSTELDLHHMGSTSIPDIHAKPILDILGIVPSIEAFDRHRSELEDLGFVWKGEYGITNRRYCVLYDETEEVGLIHLHVFAKDDSEVEKHLLFRDYLRASPEASCRYQELKLKLAATHAEARTNYSEGKSELIGRLLIEAFEWKKLKIARHEIGHAVMALRFGQKIQKISLKGLETPDGLKLYRAYMKLEPRESTVPFTGDRAIQKVMISLGGYASEIIFYDVANIGYEDRDDLTISARIVRDMMEVEGFRNWVVTLPIPAPGPLEMVEDSLVRRYIDFKMGECIGVLGQIKQVIQLVADELYRKEELTGDEFSALFDSFMQSILGMSSMRRT